MFLRADGSKNGRKFLFFFFLGENGAKKNEIGL